MKAIHGNGMKYEIGNTYKIPEGTKLIPCENGFHFCRDLEDIQGYYDLASSRLFLVEATGDTMYHFDKALCSEITIVRELTTEDILSYVSAKTKLAKEDLLLIKNIDSLNWDLTILLAKTIVDENIIDFFFKNKNYDVKRAATYALVDSTVLSDEFKTKYLDILVTDKNLYAKQIMMYAVSNSTVLSDEFKTRYLNILVADENRSVRRSVAYALVDALVDSTVISDKIKIKYLDILVADEDCDIRETVVYTIADSSVLPDEAKMKYLDALVADEDLSVRKHMVYALVDSTVLSDEAKIKYLDILCRDKRWRVRKTAVRCKNKINNNK